MVERDSAQADVAALHAHRLAGEQRADGRDRLLQELELRRRLGADLTHPVVDAVPEPRVEACGMQSRESGDLHRGEGGVAGGRGHDPESDRDSLGGRQCGRTHRYTAGEKAVLPQPQLREAGGLGASRMVDERLGAQLGPDDDAEIHPGEYRCSRPAGGPSGSATISAAGCIATPPATAGPRSGRRRATGTIREPVTRRSGPLEGEATVTTEASDLTDAATAPLWAPRRGHRGQDDTGLRDRARPTRSATERRRCVSGRSIS